MLKENKQHQPCQGSHFSQILTGLSPGIYLYLAALPVSFDLSLIWLIMVTLITTFSCHRLPTWSHTDTTLLAILCAWFISVSLSIDWQRSLELSSTLIPGLLCYWILRLQPLNHRILFTLALGFGLCGLIFSIQIIFAAFTQADPQTIINDSGILIMVTPNDGVLLLVCASVCKLYRHRYLLILSTLVIVLTVACVWILQSRLMALLLLSAIAAQLLLRSHRYQWWLLIAISGSMILIDAYFDWLLIGKFTGWFDNRWQLWKAAVDQFMGSPLWGQGMHTFGLLYDPSLLPSSGEFDRRSMPWPHNLFLELLAGGGLLLFSSAALVWLRIWILCACIKDLFYRTNLLILLGIITLSAALDLTLLRLWTVVAIFLVIGISNHIRKGILCHCSNVAPSVP